MYGVRALSMFTSLHPLRHGRCLTQVFPSCTFKEIRNLSQTSWSSVKILNQREPRTFGSFLADHFSSQPYPSKERRINKVILSLKTVKEQLELFERIKNSANIVNRVTMLYSIAKITGRDGNQRRVLTQEKGKSRQALNSAYLALLDSISKDIPKCQNRHLANVTWALGKIEEKDDEPVQVCELNAGTVFDRVEEEILRRGTANLERRHIVQILWAFSKAEKGGKQLFYTMDKELALRGVEGFVNSGLLQIVWSFATRDVTNAKVFNLVKDEVFNRGVGMFETHELVLILYSFVFAQRQNIKLVEEIESELLSRDVKQLDNGHLCQVAWSLGRARKSDSKMFDVIEESVFQRGLHQFSKSQKFMLLRGYVEAKKGSRKLYEGLQVSFLKSCFSDLTAREIYQLAWYFSEAEIDTGPLINTGQLFDALEREILAKEKLFFKKELLHGIKNGFRKVGKGSKELLEL